MQATIASISRGAKALLLLAGLAVNLEGGPAWAAPSGSPWGASYFPNVELITQDGQKVRFYDDLIKGKVFAINFIYTHCVYACPLETAALRKVQQALGDRMGKDVHFYTISIDAERDKPEVLKAYADKFHTGPGWTFLSGSKADVTLIRQKLGMYRDDGKQEKDLSEHNINVLMGSETGGQWIKRSPFEEPAALARILGVRLQGGRGHAVPPMAIAMHDHHDDTPGQSLFRDKCEVCHSEDSTESIGPPLAGVTQRRDRTWLKQWIKEPDRMIARKDPTALALYRQYREIPMSNLKLNDREVESILQYLEASDRRAQVPVTAAAEPPTAAR
ncbi:SCO family protein [Methyloterricola oryzae]|uniref:SCO family protein n=1 Tax=Methyloterricola oryzae TaxID=1495050 RepID=UPI0005EB2D18|nr:SCO family protein [Methyloterricola oryzae]